jgi:hypothetical protein
MADTTQVADRIAQRFVGILRDWLTADEWAAMVAANRAETDPRVCHSHDYCDANEAMFEACGADLGEIDPSDEAQAAIWNAAWERAMPLLRGAQ